MDEFANNPGMVSNLRNNWVVTGALVGAAGTALKSLASGLLSRTGATGVNSMEVTRRAVFGKPSRGILPVAPLKWGLGRSIGGAAIETVLGAGLGTGVAYMASRSKPVKGLWMGALYGVGLSALSLGVAGFRKTGVLQKAPAGTIGTMVLTGGVVGALSGLAMSLLSSPTAQTRPSRQTGHYVPNEPVHEEPVDFVH